MRGGIRFCEIIDLCYVVEYPMGTLFVNAVTKMVRDLIPVTFIR